MKKTFNKHKKSMMTIWHAYNDTIPKVVETAKSPRCLQAISTVLSNCRKLLQNLAENWVFLRKIEEVCGQKNIQWRHSLHMKQSTLNGTKIFSGTLRLMS